MKGQMTVRQYRSVDLFLFAAMLLVFESIIIFAATRWFSDAPYSVSVTAAVTAIVMIRWGPWAAIHAVLGGLIFCFESGGANWQYAVYCGGNLLAMLILPVVKRPGAWKKVCSDPFKTVCFGLGTVLLMQLGRALLSLVFGLTVGEALGFFTADVISLLFTALILWIVRRLDGILEDQVHYLHRIAKEREEENKGGF